jgi:hypothetical protein
VAKDDGKTPETHLAMKQRMGERDGSFANRTAITSLAVKVQAWPSPRSEDGESCGNHPGVIDSLTGATKNWATPNAHDGRRPGSDATSTQGANLKRDAEIWQTPASDSFRSRGGDRKDEMGLDQQARYFPTPTAGDAKSSRAQGYSTASGRHSGTTLTDAVCRSLPAQVIPDGLTSCEKGRTSRQLWQTPKDIATGANQRRGGNRSDELLLTGQAAELVGNQKSRLNPRFVEWLMGFPISWSEL